MSVESPASRRVVVPDILLCRFSADQFLKQIDFLVFASTAIPFIRSELLYFFSPELKTKAVDSDKENCIWGYRQAACRHRIFIYF